MRRARHPDHGDEGEAVFDRRQPLGAGDRVRRDGGPVGRAAAGRLGDDRGRRRPSRARSSSGSSRACRSRSTATVLPLHELSRAERDRRRVRLGPHRHGREPPRRHQEPRDLRVPGGAGAPHGARRPRVDHPRARPRPREAAPRVALRRAGLRRALVLAAEAGARRLRRREPALRHRRGAAAARARPLQVDGRRSPNSLYDYGLATYDAADAFRHEDSAGFVRLWGLGVQTWAAKQGRTS